MVMRVLTSLKESTLSQLGVQIYPNPTQGQFNIKTAGMSLEPLMVKIYTLNGKLLQSHIIRSNEMQLDLSGHAAGMYLISVQQGELIGHEKVVKY